MIDLKRYEIAPSTRETYVIQLRMFRSWLAESGRPFGTMEERDEACAAFIQVRYDEGMSPATIKQFACAVRWNAVQERQPNPIGRDATAALKGASRQGAGRGSGQVDGLDWTAVEAACALATAEGTTKGLRDAALLAVGSDALLRISEVKALDLADVEPQEDGAGVLVIRKSKTDQTGAGARLFLGPPTMAKLNAWLAARGTDAGVLFCCVTRQSPRSPGRPLTARRLHVESIRAVIVERAAAAGYARPDHRISGHSLRIGSAQELARRGAALPELMQVGRWKNVTTVQRYIAGQQASRGAMAALRYAS